jgi:hypothetical protein
MTCALRAAGLGNVSTRGQVGTGDNILIGGLIIGGRTPKPVVLRALGPTLTQFGVTGVLADAYLELRDGKGNLVEANNDWQQSPEAATIRAVAKRPQTRRSQLWPRHLIRANIPLRSAASVVLRAWPSLKSTTKALPPNSR